MALGVLAGYIGAIPLVTPPASGQTTWIVDDDAPGDPGPGDPAVSDPMEDGSADHPFDAIQEGIDVALDGDVVVVADGTYTGNGNRDLDFAGRAIAVLSENGPENCIIDCQADWSDKHRGFYFHCGETAAALVDGLTIRNGWVDPNSPAGGGGIHCEGSSPTIRGCTITGNTADSSFGAGVLCLESSAIIRDCLISGNTTGIWGGRGGGVYCGGSGTPTILGCSIAGNSAAAGGGLSCFQSSAIIADCAIAENTAYQVHGGRGGAGIYCDQSSPIISNCTLAENVEFDWWQGGAGINCSDGSNPLITNCRIARNRATWAGGGIFCSQSNPAIWNCTITDNLATAYESDGGGIYLHQSQPTISDSTIAGNDAEEGGGVFCYQSDAKLTNCILWGNTRGQVRASYSTPLITYCAVRHGWPGTGNIDADPLFGDPDGPDDDPNTWEDNDYRLSAGSPCIDAGNNDAVPPDAADLDHDGDTGELTPVDLLGDPRFVDDPGMPDDGYPPGGGPLVDMGAYEFQGETCFADLDHDGKIGLGDLAVLLANYGTAAGAAYTDGDLNWDGDVDVADLAELLAIYGTICP